MISTDNSCQKIVISDKLKLGCCFSLNEPRQKIFDQTQAGKNYS